jgi:hypothetical protein
LEDKEMKLNTFIEARHIRMEAKYVDRNPNMAADDEWMRSATHWRVTFRRGRHQLTTYFSQGSAITGEPTAADVLDCLASDASSIDNARGFEEWASELGYDADSRKAEKTFKACERSAEKLHNFLGPALYQQLLYETERL